MNTTDCRLIVFAKTPIPGQVKTRLFPSLGAEAAAALYEQLILHSLDKAFESGIGPVDLWCTPSSDHPFFIHCAEKFKVGLYQQTEGDIGRRMAHSFSETLKRTHYVLLMGTDCPSLTCADLREGATALYQGADAVISPAEDGGYVLIGLRHYAPDLFSGISWGTNTVMKETRLRLRRLRWRWHELPKHWDVDRPEDLERLMTEGHLSYVNRG